MAHDVLAWVARMDLNTITTVRRPLRRDDLGALEPGEAWLAGGTWLFSEPQPRVSGLVDLEGLAWPSLEATEAGLSIAATCTIATLDAFEPPTVWVAGPLISQCCQAFLASFKIWNVATVGGNICLALPAAPMISLCAALAGECILWAPDGSERRVCVTELVTGPQQTALRPGELLRRIELSREALCRRAAFRRISLTPLGRSGALLIGTRSSDGAFVLTITASVRRPLRVAFQDWPDAAALRSRLDHELTDEVVYDDVHGRPDWRRHVTREFATEILAELSDGAA